MPLSFVVLGLCIAWVRRQVLSCRPGDARLLLTPFWVSLGPMVLLWDLDVLVYYIVTQGQTAGDFIGFGGLENVRFRAPVRPGDRLVLVGKGLRLHRRQTVFNVQGFVGSTMVFHADVLGVPLRKGET